MPSHPGVGGADGQVRGEIEAFRAGFYALLGAVLASPPDHAVLASLTQLEGDESPLGQALSELSGAALRGPDPIRDEYTRLFYGMGQGGEVLPYASFYLTGSLHSQPLAELRADMERLGIARSGLNAEPEDHIAFVFEMMHGLIVGSFGTGPTDLTEQTRFFDAHLAPWAAEFFADLESAESSDFYASVARTGQAFLAVEADAFHMAA